MHSWLTGQRLPMILMAGNADIREKRAYEVNIPPEESESFAYFLGAYCGSVRSGHAIYHFRPRVAHPAVAEKIARGFEDVVDSKARTVESVMAVGKYDWKFYEVNCLSLPLSRYMNSITRANQRLPWEHLGTEREQFAFLRGVFDLNSSVGLKSAKMLSLQKTGGEYLIVELAHLMMQIGIVPRVRSGSKPVLSINEVGDLSAFAEKIGFTDPDQQARLLQISARPVSRTTYSSKDYYRACRYWTEHPQLDDSQIARDLELPRESIRSWRKRGQEPKEVIRTRELVSLLEGHEREVGLLPLLYRESGLSPAQCQQVVPPAPRFRFVKHRRS